MTALPVRRLLLLACVGLVGVWLVPVASACPFCASVQGETLTGEVKQASMVLYGTLQNPQLGKTGDFGEGTTDLAVEAVIKDHHILKGRKLLPLPRYVPVDKEGEYKFLVFCDVFKDKIDPYRGIAVKADSHIDQYLHGALKVKDEKVSTRLRYFFDHLDSPDVEISNDAYQEFAKADYEDYRAMAVDLPAERLAKWLQDPKTSTVRYGLYGSMLGHTGKKEHAPTLRSILEDAARRPLSGVDGILAGYVMLLPKEGWAYLSGILKDDKAEFTLRYAALRAVRFFYESRPDLIPKKDSVAAAALLLEQGDIADLAIEDLRKWQRWETATQILALTNRKSHDVPIVRRAILRFALSCPSLPEAATYVAELRKKDPTLVEEAEELLKLETNVPTPTTKK